MPAIRTITINKYLGLQKRHTHLVCSNKTDKQWKKWSWNKSLGILSEDLNDGRICFLCTNIIIQLYNTDILEVNKCIHSHSVDNESREIKTDSTQQMACRVLNDSPTN